MTYELMDKELAKQLVDYRLAWPIIQALQKKGTRDLIQILNEAQEDALTALSRLTPGSDLAHLIDVFLAKNIQDLEMINRERLIRFLRWPECLSSFLSQEHLARVSELLSEQSTDSTELLVNEDSLAELYGANCLKDFLVNYYNKPRFAAGFERFVAYAKQYKKEHLLSDALALLVNADDVDNPQTLLIDSVLQSLIETNATAAILLRLIDDNSLEMHKVTSFFTKKQVMIALQAVNKLPDWEHSALYQLVLKILATQYSTLFPSKDFSYGHRQSWNSAELKELVQFISRHLSKKTSLDHHHALGYKILAELIFRCAQSGEITLFYANKTLNRMMTHLSFTRPFLERLIDKFWIPGGVKELFTDTVMRIKTWLTDGSTLHKELGKNRGLMDWRHLIKQTWQDTNKNKLPIICVYLLNYSGSKEPLSFLLRDYFNTFQNAPDYLYPVVKLLQLFPQREVSAVIFDVLEKVLIKNPNMLDEKILTHMARYYIQKIAKPQECSPELDLLVYFGQNKHYLLAQRGCELLAQKTEDKRFKKRLSQAANEAQVEYDLSASLGSPYFTIIKLVKRLWHYGSAKNSSGMVTRCDEECPAPPGNTNEQMTILPLNDKISPIYLEFSEKRKQLIRLLTTINHSPVTPSLMPLSSYSGQTLFSGALEASTEKREKVVDTEQAVVNSI